MKAYFVVTIENLRNWSKTEVQGLNHIFATNKEHLKVIETNGEKNPEKPETRPEKSIIF